MSVPSPQEITRHKYAYLIHMNFTYQFLFQILCVFLNKFVTLPINP